MTVIHLVRHGQASWGKREYDNLSPLGMRQGAVLGEALAARGVRPDLLVTGSMRRHEQTAQAAAAAAGWTGEATPDPGFAEFDHMGVIAAHKPAYRSMVLMKADLARTFHPRVAFHDMFLTAMDRWTRGEHPGDYVESFEAFCARVDDALERLTGAVPDGGTAVVVTSAGVISRICARLLSGPTETWIAVNKVLVNTGVTTLELADHGLGDGRGLRLVTLNDHAHLTEGNPELVTRR
ncbi:histidine phosphatase family protein [Janibacter sp. G56]|uniref:histidine phosphatase family protein n=1 Tax=Janibacter sp. G56 TaxID=3418717 RepID=UPI003CFBD074